MTKTNRRQLILSSTILGVQSVCKGQDSGAAQNYHVALMILLLNNTYRDQFVNKSTPTGDLSYLKQRNGALYTEIQNKFGATYSPTDAAFHNPLDLVRQVFYNLSPASAHYGGPGTCPCVAGVTCPTIKALVP